MKLRSKPEKTAEFIFNPRFLLCFGIAWMITNGWSYVLLGVGTFYNVGWMLAVAGGYLTFLWLPISPEKIVTVAIAIALLKLIFPRDEKTLAVLVNMKKSVMEKLGRKKDGKENDEKGEEK